MMHLATGIRQLITCPSAGDANELGIIEDAAMLWEDGIVSWTGPASALTSMPFPESLEHHDLEQRIVVPGLVDAHTHLAFAGWRADEFGLRCRGASYQEIAQAGGGIVSTVAKTRSIDEEALYERASYFLDDMLCLGVTTVEAKSGYGLSLEAELKQLRVYRRLMAERDQKLVATCLAAHTLPPEYKSDREGYARLVIEEIIPAVAREGLASFCDVFVEDGAFTVDEARAILETGKKHGLRPKLHVDQLGDGKGAVLAGSVSAISADHLEYTGPDGIQALAKAGVIAVTLPIATLYLRQQPLDARPYFEAGVHVAVATDFNPGSAPSYHLPFAMTLACTMNHMTPAQALRGATINGARAIGLEDEVGSLEPGKRADFLTLDAESVDHWLYHFREGVVQDVFVKGWPIARP